MAKQTANQNANSGTPAGAESQITAVPASGPLHVSALADALAKNFESQAADDPTSQVQPPGDGGQADPGQAAAPETDSANESAELQPAAEGEQPEAAAAETSEELEAGANAPANEQDDVPAGVKKRITALLKQNEQLAAKLATLEEKLTAAPAKAAAGPAGPGPLDSVTDAAELSSREAVLSDAVEECNQLLAVVGHKAQQVEAHLRKSGVKLTDADGNDDFSTEAMVDFLANTRREMSTVLRAIPKRRQYLESYQVEHAKALAAFPWLGQKADERHALVPYFLSQAPGLQSHPNYEYWLGCAIEKHLELEAKRNAGARAPAARAANGKPASQPNTGRNPSNPPRVSTAQQTVASARQRVLKEGSKAALSAFFESTDFAKANQAAAARRP